MGNWKLVYIAEMANRRMKWSEIWDLGMVPLTLQRSRSFGVVCWTGNFPEIRFQKAASFTFMVLFQSFVYVFPVTVHRKAISLNLEFKN